MTFSFLSMKRSNLSLTIDSSCKASAVQWTSLHLCSRDASDRSTEFNVHQSKKLKTNRKLLSACRKRVIHFTKQEPTLSCSFPISSKHLESVSPQDLRILTPVTAFKLSPILIVAASLLFISCQDCVVVHVSPALTSFPGLHFLNESAIIIIHFKKATVLRVISKYPSWALRISVIFISQSEFQHST